MVDRLTPQQRSSLMARVRDKNTLPELKVRRLAHALSFRFRLHPHHLPGKPDLVSPRLQKIIFVHGCFWHQHNGCPSADSPQFLAQQVKAKTSKEMTASAPN
jgi:DNA mismatch endonuclease (patch repair protein)